MKTAELRQALEKGSCPPLICLFGEETFRRDQVLQMIIDQVVPEDARDFNLAVFQGKEAFGQAMLEQLQTLPVFSPRRLVLVKDFSAVPAAESEKLLDYLAAPLSETILVLVADKIDRRRKFFQVFGKKGVLIEFKPLYPNQIPAFVEQQVQVAGKRMTEDAMAFFCRRVGTNLQEIHGELEKLCSYLGDRNLVDVDDVRAVVSDIRADSVFDLTNALGKKQTSEALRLLGRLLADGMAPVLVLSMMVRHFRQLWKTSELLAQGGGRKDIAAAIRVNPYFIDGLIRQARQFRTAQFEAWFELFLEADLKLKSSGGNPRAILEALVMKLAV